jgi:uncharacterized protein (TIGR03435 family)
MPEKLGRAGAILVVLASAAAVALVAQPAADAPAFEVASVKSWPSGRVGGATIEYSPNGLTLRGIDLWIGLTVAYGVRDFQISGPDWLQMPPRGTGNRYDIEAKAPGPSSNDQLRLMLRTLLAERFHLTLHRETKDLPVLALMVAKGGSKLRETAPGTQIDSTWNGFANVRHEPVATPDGRRGHSFTNASMAVLAAALSASMPFTPEPVVDMTGLAGRFDFVFHDAPRAASNNAAPRSASDGPPNFDDMVAAQRMIVQDELGLTWERRKAPVEVLVVDHVDRMPTEN